MVFLNIISFYDDIEGFYGIFILCEILVYLAHLKNMLQ